MTPLFKKMFVLACLALVSLPLIALASPSGGTTAGPDGGGTGYTLRVTSPNGGERWTAGEVQTIRWQGEGLTGDAAIVLFRDDAFFSTVGWSPAASGTCDWKLPANLPPGTYQVKVEAAGLADLSDAPFTVQTGKTSGEPEEAPAGPIPKLPPDLVERTFIDESGREVMVVRIAGRPPVGYTAPPAFPKTSASTLTLVPAFTWSFGCTATSAAMIAGYYDNHGFANMYAGPTNGGVMPQTNATWGTVVINGETRALCPLSATRNGLDGRAIRGHVDDYWVEYGSTAADPYIGNWTQHTYGDCTGDYMKTNQSAYSSPDGATSIYTYPSGSPYRGSDAPDDGATASSCSWPAAATGSPSATAR